MHPYDYWWQAARTRRRRRNPADDRRRRAQRTQARERADEAQFMAWIHETVRAGQVASLTVADFARAAELDLGLFAALPAPIRASLTEAAAAAHVVQPGDWFLRHTDVTVCPHGHRFGQTEGQPRPVEFALIEAGMPVYRTLEAVEAGDPGRVTLRAGDWDNGDAVEYILTCEARHPDGSFCGASWPLGQAELDYE